MLASEFEFLAPFWVLVAATAILAPSQQHAEHSPLSSAAVGSTSYDIFPLRY